MDQTYKTESAAIPGPPNDFYIGLILAMSSSVFIGSSFILTKKGLQRISVRASRGGFGYLKQWKWWAGLTLMGIGEACNFAAFAFAPATLVTSLGALSVLVSAVMSSYCLSEKLNLLGKIGCVLCILGSTIVVMHSPKEQDVQTMKEFIAKMQHYGFIAYIIVVSIGVLWLVFYASRRWGNSNPLVYITITGTIGSLTVISCKGLGIGLKQTVTGMSQLSNPALYMILVTVAACITIQMIYLNRALDLFNTAVVTPLLYVIFTGCVILASAVLFREWSGLSAEDVVGNLCGFLVIVIGIFLLQALRELNISLKNLPRARKNDARTVESSFSRSNSSSGEQIGLNVETGLLRSNSGAHVLTSTGEYHSRANSY